MPALAPFPLPGTDVDMVVLEEFVLRCWTAVPPVGRIDLNLVERAGRVHRRRPEVDGTGIHRRIVGPVGYRVRARAVYQLDPVPMARVDVVQRGLPPVRLQVL